MDSRYVTGAPLWVWPLLGLLIWIGLRATKERDAPVALYWLLPLFVLLPLRSIIGSAWPALAWSVFAGAYLAGAHAGYRYQVGVVIARDGARVRVRGEWVTLATVLAVFLMSYLRGAMGAVAPEVLGSAAGVAAFAALSGALSGQFAGRTLSVIRWRPAVV